MAANGGPPDDILPEGSSARNALANVPARSKVAVRKGDPPGKAPKQPAEPFEAEYSAGDGTVTGTFSYARVTQGGRVELVFDDRPGHVTVSADELHDAG